MPWVPEDPPACVILERDGFTFAVGDQGGDFSWDDVDALTLQADRWSQRHEIPVERVDNSMLRGIVQVMRKFPDSTIEDFKL